MKPLLTLMIVSLFACNKNYDIQHKTIIKPSITGIEITGQMIITQTGAIADTVIRPKITFTLSVPDTASVNRLYVYKLGGFPFNLAGNLTKLSSGKISVIDLNQKYPPTTTLKYTSIFGLADGYFMMNDTFDVK